MWYFVYALTDPREEGPRAVGCVGCTHRSLNVRLREHIDGKRGIEEKLAWVQRLLEEGVEPDVDL